MVCRGGAEESEVSEELRSFASSLVELAGEEALVDLAEEDSGETDMYRSQSGITFGFTADLRSR